MAKAGLLFAAGATLLFAGCDNGNDDGGDNESKKLQLTVDLTAPAGYEASQLPAMTVTAVNSDKELTYTETTAAGATVTSLSSSAFSIATIAVMIFVVLAIPRRSFSFFPYRIRPLDASISTAEEADTEGADSA